MRSLVDLAELQVIDATQEARSQGGDLERAGHVQVLRFTPASVVAEVEGPATRVELAVTEAGLRWYCSCAEGRVAAFCRHCVATALTILHRLGRKP
ncbi:hypothetical protein Aph01nite_18970 [Acrocarpospora phusangensis]|uniref:SWIM-type domain-containing protein n=1 Tax=Acrocarpospora phusangensis TaxID=1070424 RepID=A0A919Q774_9ACTN|nr:hypothetical protein [Acrocarpospora phusangensis]GIH23587.1 hypothetical protein Aph01nite_18970 [Acrocarpospora phusangensis]